MLLQVWIQNNPKFHHATVDVMHYLTAESFQKIITFLEKQAGYSPDILPQIHAERLIMERFKSMWPYEVAIILVPELYQYWIKKREKKGKPLCRRYWPQTPASDTNPHHVFRPRDKERYRLRRQQRKNDIEAYRKMQQLRREFGRARELLQLVLERESLNEYSLTLQRSIHELEIRDMDKGNVLRPLSTMSPSSSSSSSSSSSVTAASTSAENGNKSPTLSSSSSVSSSSSSKPDVATVQNDITTANATSSGNTSSSSSSSTSSSNEVKVVEGEFVMPPPYTLQFPHLIDTPLVYFPSDRSSVDRSLATNGGARSEPKLSLLLSKNKRQSMSSSASFSSSSSSNPLGGIAGEGGVVTAGSSSYFAMDVDGEGGEESFRKKGKLPAFSCISNATVILEINTCHI